LRDGKRHLTYGIVADLALSHKLAEEIKYEKEAAQDIEPDFLKSFKAQGIWTVSLDLFIACAGIGFLTGFFLVKIENSTGHDEVTLTRKFGSERSVLKVRQNVHDLERDLYSVRLMFSIADINSSQQENDFEGMEGEENEVPEHEEEPVDSYPIRCSFSVTKVCSHHHSLSFLTYSRRLSTEHW
jgi:complement component 1 Q subcomponent-binding protein